MESIKKQNDVELVKYDNGKYGVIDHVSGEESGPRYKSLEMAENIYDRWVKEAE